MRQPSVKYELYHAFKEEIALLEVGNRGRTPVEKQRIAKAVSAMEILNLICVREEANG